MCLTLLKKSANTSFLAQDKTARQEMFHVKFYKYGRVALLLWKGWSVDIQYVFILLPLRITS